METIKITPKTDWVAEYIARRIQRGLGTNGMKPIANKYIVEHTSRTHQFHNHNTEETVAFVAQTSWAVLDVTMRDENGCWLIVKDGFATAKTAKEFAKDLVK